MDTEIVNELSGRIKELAADLYESTDSLKTQINHTDWTGFSAYDYFCQVHDLSNKIHNLAIELVKYQFDLRAERTMDGIRQAWSKSHQS